MFDTLFQVRSPLWDSLGWFRNRVLYAIARALPTLGWLEMASESCFIRYFTCARQPWGSLGWLRNVRIICVPTTRPIGWRLFLGRWSSSSGLLFAGFLETQGFGPNPWVAVFAHFSRRSMVLCVFSRNPRVWSKPLGLGFCNLLSPLHGSLRVFSKPKGLGPNPWVSVFAGLFSPAPRFGLG